MNTLAHQAKFAKNLFEYIFPGENNRFKIILHKSNLFFFLGLLFCHKFRILLYTPEKNFISQEFYKELKISRTSLSNIKLQNVNNCTEFDFKIFEQMIHIDRRILDNLLNQNNKGLKNSMSEVSTCESATI